MKNSYGYLKVDHPRACYRTVRATVTKESMFSPACLQVPKPHSDTLFPTDSASASASASADITHRHYFGRRQRVGR